MNIKSISQASKEDLALAKPFSSFQSVESLISQARSKAQAKNLLLADKVIGSNMSFPKIIELMGRAETEISEWDRTNNVERDNLVILKNDYILDYCYASLPEKQRPNGGIPYFTFWLGSLNDQELSRSDIYVKFIDTGIGRMTGRVSTGLKNLIGMDEKYVNDHLYFHNLLDKLDTVENPVVVKPLNEDKLKLMIVPISLYLKLGNEGLFRSIINAGGIHKSYIIPPPMLSRPELESKMPFEEFIKDLIAYNGNNDMNENHYPDDRFSYNNHFDGTFMAEDSMLLFYRKSHFDRAVSIANQLIPPIPQDNKPLHQKTENWKKFLEIEKELKKGHNNK